MPRLHVQIRGRVQGVGFRYAAYRQAQALGLTGWVRNVVDGSVEAEFEGSRPRLEEMQSWCEIGPPYAQVDAVECRWFDTEGGYGDFDIR